MIYKFLRCAITLFMNLVYRPTIEGKENIPLQGSVILAGNHTDYLDWFLVVSSTKRTVHFLGKHLKKRRSTGHFPGRNNQQNFERDLALQNGSSLPFEEDEQSDRAICHHGKISML